MGHVQIGRPEGLSRHTNENYQTQGARRALGPTWARIVPLAARRVAPTNRRLAATKSKRSPKPNQTERLGPARIGFIFHVSNICQLFVSPKSEH